MQESSPLPLDERVTRNVQVSFDDRVYLSSVGHFIVDARDPLSEFAKLGEPRPPFTDEIDGIFVGSAARRR
jgi:hypothetical protein